MPSAASADSYRPVRSQLCRGSEPVDVVAGLLTVHPFATLYIADLDAIQARGNSDRVHSPDPAEISRTLRSGSTTVLPMPGACRDWLAQGLSELVLGSEAQRDRAILDAPVGGRCAPSSHPLARLQG